jgi:hypothetical protein
MNRIVFLFLSLSVIGFSSCNRGIEDKNTATIDSLLTHIVDAERVLMMLDSNHLATMKTEYDKQYAFFSEAPEDLSNKDFYTGPLMDMATCRKRLNVTLMNFSNWRRELEFAKKQLTTLREDYSNGFFTPEEFEKNLNLEGRAATDIITQTTKNVGTTSNCMGSFDALIARLDSAQTAISALSQ